MSNKILCLYGKGLKGSSGDFWENVRNALKEEGYDVLELVGTDEMAFLSKHRPLGLIADCAGHSINTERMEVVRRAAEQGTIVVTVIEQRRVGANAQKARSHFELGVKAVTFNKTSKLAIEYLVSLFKR